jgi:hypothetical protein
MTPDDYPRDRPRFFAHKAVRLMFKMCIAQELGPEALLLLVAIVHTEDAKGYRSAVTFFNEQLMPICGLADVRALIRARERAVEAGWLHYERGTKGVAGKYWVTIPQQYRDVDDQPTDESTDEFSLKNDMAKMSGKVQGKCQGKRRESVRECVNHSSLYLSLSPSSCSEPEKPAPEPPFLTFPCTGQPNDPKTWELTRAKMEEYRQSFPAVDVEAECRKARQWCIDNPRRQKTARGMPRFLNGWLSKEQDRGPRRLSHQDHEQASADRAAIVEQSQQRREAFRVGTNGKAGHHA